MPTINEILIQKEEVLSYPSKTEFLVSKMKQTMLMPGSKPGDNSNTSLNPTTTHHQYRKVTFGSSDHLKKETSVFFKIGIGIGIEFGVT